MCFGVSQRVGRAFAGRGQAFRRHETGVGGKSGPHQGISKRKGGAGRGGSGAGPGPEVTVGLVAGKGTKISCAPALRGHSYNHRPVVSPQNAPGTLAC